jgi:hypothetical protein
MREEEKKKGLSVLILHNFYWGGEGGRARKRGADLVAGKNDV